MNRLHIVRYSAHVQRQLEAIRAYIAREADDSTANNFVGAIIDLCDTLETFAERGTAREDVSPGLRTLAFRRRAVIVYRVKDYQVLITVVYYGGQDWERRVQRPD